MRRTASVLIAIVLGLLSLGIVMLASTSSVRGAATFDDPGFFLKRQLAWLVVALSAGALAAGFDYHWWQKRWVAVALVLVAYALLVAVLIPGIGTRVGGSNRWLRLGPFSLQASEVAKIALVVGLANWIVWSGRRLRRFRDGLLIPMAFVGLMLILLLLEPDFGTTLLLGGAAMLVLYAGGTQVSHLVVTAAAGGCAFALAVMHDSVRMTRILAFLAPDEHPAAAYHLLQSRNAFVSGGWGGVGLGNSIQKQFYLPEAHTDFILAIVGEELGLPATAGVLLGFVGLIACGLIISHHARDSFGRVLAFGFTVLIGMQALINMGVVTGCLPTKGLPLPFISYGGSNLVMNLVAVGVLLNIARHHDKGYKDTHTKVIRDRIHDF